MLTKKTNFLNHLFDIPPLTENFLQFAKRVITNDFRVGIFSLDSNINANYTTHDECVS